MTGELLIGRGAEGVGSLGGDHLLSRSHARIACGADGACSITDLGSRNGTRVNGTRISSEQELRFADRVSLGSSELEIGLQPRARDGGEPGPEAQTTVGRSVPLTVPRPVATEVREPAERTGVLLDASTRYEVPEGGLTIGRADDNAVVIASDRVSRHHARIDRTPDGWAIADLGSANGTRVNGTRLISDECALRDGDEIALGERDLEFVVETDGRTRKQDKGRGPAPLERSVTSLSKMVRIGRDPHNDCVLEDPNVSRFHAVLTSVGGVTTIRDLGSRNGTHVDGTRVEEARLGPQSEIGIGPFTLGIEHDLLKSERRALHLVADGVSITANGKEILQPTSLTVTPGTFLAIIGGSGAGKTTLLKTLAGVTPPTRGEVRVNGDPLSVRQSAIGYVPQDEIVHGLLTVREALRYAARLRLPDDTGQQEVDGILETVMGELDLLARADSRIAVLSGGQRKRAGVGTELVSRPHLLFLDEATTGLDPVLERRMMELMRALARHGRTVITVTHATRNLDLCDALAVMGAGGRLCFHGSPQCARAFFEVEDTDEIYGLVDEGGAGEWHRRFAERSTEDALKPARGGPPRRDVAAAPARPVAVADGADASAERPRSGGLNLEILSNGAVEDAQPREPEEVEGDEIRKRSPARQTRILTARYARIFLRDQRNLLLLLGQVPVLAAAIAGLYPRDLWSAPRDAKDVSGLIFLVVTLAIWVGAITSSREIIKEKVVLEREAAIGVGRIPYLLSKLGVLGLLGTIQAVVLLLVVVLIRPGMPHQPQVLLLVLLTVWVSIAMGLLISASVGTENQSVSLIPLALIPQLLFAGQIVPYGSMPSLLKAISTVVFARWSFAGVGRAVDLPGRLSPRVLASSYGHDFFSHPVGFYAGVLAAFLFVFLAITSLLLRRRWR